LLPSKQNTEILPNGGKRCPCRNVAMVSSSDFLRAPERPTAIATLNRSVTLRHHAKGSPLPRREQWAPARMLLESLTPRPGIREQYRPKADMRGDRLARHVASSSGFAFRLKHADSVEDRQQEGHQSRRLYSYAIGSQSGTDLRGRKILGIAFNLE
jgi:hypothetical protein